MCKLVQTYGRPENIQTAYPSILKKKKVKVLIQKRFFLRVKNDTISKKGKKENKLWLFQRKPK